MVSSHEGGTPGHLNPAVTSSTSTAIVGTRFSPVPRAMMRTGTSSNCWRRTGKCQRAACRRLCTWLKTSPFPMATPGKTEYILHAISIPISPQEGKDTLLTLCAD